MDITNEVKPYIKALHDNFFVYRIRADNYQLHQLITDLRNEGYPISEIPQTDTHMAPAADILLDLVKHTNILLPNDRAIEFYAHNVVAKHGRRGWTFKKDQNKGTKKIDFMIALAIATLEATHHLDFLKSASAGSKESEWEQSVREAQLRQEREFHDGLGQSTEEEFFGPNRPRRRRNEKTQETWGEDEMPMDDLFNDPFGGVL